MDRVYLTLGMGNSYNVSPGVGTVGWVDKLVVGSTTYDFVLPAVVSTPASSTWSIVLAGLAAFGVLAMLMRRSSREAV